jgi:hypothetical protein
MSRRSFGTIRKLGSGRFQVRYRNALGRLVPAPRTFATKAEAQRWLVTAEADQLRGTFVDQRSLRMTFDEWVAEWLAAKPGQRGDARPRPSGDPDALEPGGDAAGRSLAEVARTSGRPLAGAAPLARPPSGPR